MNMGLKGRAPMFQSGLDLELDGSQVHPLATIILLSRNIRNKSRITTTVNPALRPSCVAGAHVDATRLPWYTSTHLLLLIFRRL
jgi:hypothetical protein